MKRTADAGLYGDVLGDAVRVHVHERDDGHVDGVFRLIEEAGRARPLAEVLATLCAAIAGIARVDVVSVYVMEPGDPDGDVELVMRGNVGFPDSAVGNVRLRPGEGLTGFVAECMRPVSVAVGKYDERYKHVDGLGEERFPSYLGIPLLSNGAVAGVLVFQRREVHAFSPAELALAAAVAASVAFALERGKARAEEEAAQRIAPSGSTTRSARLDGVALAPGVALGRVEILPAAAGATGDGVGPGQIVGLALAKVARQLDRAHRQIEPALAAQHLPRVRALALILEDARFREMMVEECGERGVVAGLAHVAREYARVPYRVKSAGDAASWQFERAVEIEDLCALVGARTAGFQPGAGGIIVGEALSGVGALAAVARRAVGVALAGPPAESAFGAAIAQAAAIPVVAEVGGLFAWVRPDDRVLVDGDAGVVRVNPPATVVARFRATRG